MENKPEARAPEDAARENRALLEQAAELLGRLDRAACTATCDLLPGGTVGAHIRHIIDFYDLLIRGVSSGRVDYDARERSAALEADPAAARAAISDVCRRLDSLQARDLERELRVRGDAPEDDREGWSRSTVGRELGYLRSHTIHHYALIGAILRSIGITPEAGFGVAPSTLRHWRRNPPAAPPV